MDNAMGTNVTTINLTASQQSAVDGALAVLKKGEGVYRIGGFAGTGKSFLARFIFDEIPGGLPCSLTGKAACRLRQKGIPEARTIHKAQGSEWDKVIVMNQIAGSWEARRWQYTAITRAAKSLMYWIN